MDKKISFLGIKVNVLGKKEIVDFLLRFAKGERRRAVFYLNAHCVNIACSDQEYRSILNKADLVYAEGQGVVWSSKFLGMPLPERTNILDFFDALAKELKDNKIKIYLLGETEDLIRKAEEILKNDGLQIVGSHDGFFDKIEEGEIIKEINILKPDILMVGMGVPKQEKWIYKHLDELNVNLCWAVGAAFEWLSGQRRRAPRWMVKYGLEWLHRLYQQPGRLWKRYLFGNVIFLYRILSWKLKNIKNK